MNLLLIPVFAILALACAVLVFLQVRATYVDVSPRTRIFRSILAGFGLNLALLSIFIIKSLWTSGSVGPASSMLSVELWLILFQVLFTLALFAVFGLRRSIRQHKHAFEDEYGKKE